MFNQSGVWELEVDIGMSLTVYQPSVLSQSLLLSLDLTISARLAGQGTPGIHLPPLASTGITDKYHHPWLDMDPGV